MKILIDNGHGQFTPGKRSPDGQFREYYFNRIIARRIVRKLQDQLCDAELLVPEDDDIPLKERVRRVNEHCRKLGKQNVILISIHVNAYGDGTQWTKPHGWSVYTSKGQTVADCLADHLVEVAKQTLRSDQIRTDYSDGDPDYEENFYILQKTLCPAVLTENGFMTNEQECRWLQTEGARQAISRIHVHGILSYLETMK